MRPRGVQGLLPGPKYVRIVPSPDLYKVLVKSPQDSASTAYPILNMSDGHSTPPWRENYKLSN